MQINFGMKELIFFSIGIILILFLTSLFGFIGFRLGLGLILLYFLSFYLIMGNFDLNYGEKTIFAFFISLGIYPSLVYWLGFLVPFSVSIFLSFVLLLIAGFLIKKFKKK